MRTIALALFLLFSLTTKAQILHTLKEVIENNGYNYEKGVSDDGYFYIYYNKTTNGKITSSRAYYFLNVDGEMICFFVRLVEPVSKANANAAFFEERFVRIGKNKWKDFSNNIIYEIKVKEDICVTSIYLE